MGPWRTVLTAFALAWPGAAHGQPVVTESSDAVQMRACRSYWTEPGANPDPRLRGVCDYAGLPDYAGPPDDNDGLPAYWEAFFGLNPFSATGDDGPEGDPDRDGVTNRAEFLADTHPRGFYRRYLPEGATGRFFRTRLALFAPPFHSPDPPEAERHLWLDDWRHLWFSSATLRFQRTGGTTLTSYARFTQLYPAGRGVRQTLDVASVPGMEAAEFSTYVESSRPLVVDRSMTWDETGYGTHAETGMESPATTWYLAEGATHSGFDLFYLLQNPNPVPATVRVRYLRPSGVPLEKTYQLAPTSRTNIWVDVEEFPSGSGNHALANTDVSAVFESVNGTTFLVERAMYLSTAGRPFNAGHNSAGIKAPGPTWFLAEGATGSLFDLYVLVANPSNVAAQVRVTYLLPDGSTLSKEVQIAPTSRFTIWVDGETFAGVRGQPLENTAVSTKVESFNGVPVIVERAMWWPGSVDTWQEAHCAPANSQPAQSWALAEGESGGPGQVETYVLVANTSGFGGQATVTLAYENGSTDQKTISFPASSRTTVAPHVEFPEAAGQRYAVTVASLAGASGSPMLVVERAMYSSALSHWDAGTAASASWYDGRSCSDECLVSSDCGMTVDQCLPHLGLCDDFVMECVRQDPFSGDCNACRTVSYCSCARGQVGGEAQVASSTRWTWPRGRSFGRAGEKRSPVTPP